MGKAKNFFSKLASDEKDPSQMTEEELRDKQLVEEFYENGVDFSSLDQFETGSLSGDEVIRERDPADGGLIKGHKVKLSGPVYVINLSLFYQAMGTRNERLVEGLIASSERCLKKYVGDRGTFSLHFEDYYIVQFKDGCTPQNQQTVIETVNELGANFLGESYQPKVFVPLTLGEGDGEELSGPNGKAALQVSSYKAQSKAARKKQEPPQTVTSPGWKELQAGQEKSIRVEKIRGRGDGPANRNWAEQEYDGAEGRDPHWQSGILGFRPKSQWVARKGDRRRANRPFSGPDRRRSKGRRDVDRGNALVW